MKRFSVIFNLANCFLMNMRSPKHTLYMLFIESLLHDKNNGSSEQLQLIASVRLYSCNVTVAPCPVLDNIPLFENYLIDTRQ